MVLAFYASVYLYLEIILKHIIYLNNGHNKHQEVIKMAKYVCNVCGWVYDESAGCPDCGIKPGTKFEDLPDDFECPLCSVGKDDFSKE